MAISMQTPPAISLTVQPRRILVDAVVNMKVAGCVAGQRVTLRASAYDNWKEPWASSATFVADASGEVSPGAQKPVAGSYQSIDPRGLFWSMRPIHKKHTVPFMINVGEPISIEILAEVDGQPVGSTSIEMLFGLPDIIRVPVHEDGLVGTLYHPAGSGPYPGVLILSGSDAAICDNQAALLASHGYAAFTLAYFGHKGLPECLVDIPLEYFERALQWLQEQEMVEERRLGAIGLSRGGELALLLASLSPALKVVIAGAPSSHLHIGFARNDYSRAAWTYQNKALPHLKAKIDLFSGLAILWHSLRQRSLALRSLFLTTLRDDENLAGAAIPVEKIKGAVLLISGQDDQLWPSSVFAGLLMRRLTDHNHPYPSKHLDYRQAGHFVCFPYGYPCLPPLVGAQRGLACGGNVSANASAITESWEEILAFLQENLQDSSRVRSGKGVANDLYPPANRHTDRYELQREEK